MAYDSKRVKYDYFTFDGAITKAEFQRSFLVLFIIGFVLSTVIYSAALPGVFWYFFDAIRFLLIVALFSITIRRLRDLGHSPWLSLLLLILPLGIVLVVYLLLADRKSIIDI